MYPKECPNCKVSLIGDKIPEDIKHHYSGDCWNRVIGVYSMEKDRTTHWQCPDCNYTWKRF